MAGNETQADINNIQQLLVQIERVARGSDRISLRMVLPILGQRSFAPILIFAGLITVAPVLGDIPGVPTIMGAFVVLTVAQLLFRKQHIWLPRWMLDRSIASEKVVKVSQWCCRRPVYIDRLLRPRLEFMVRTMGTYAIAVTCFLIGLLMPMMEVIPFTANGAGAAFTIFGLALIADDGLLALMAFAFIVGFIALGVFGLL
ncbi:exopolysaccharide biosynthesis protein [Alkalilimnicola ehrlichii]|uniref:exopolysaccharide biosynthesis protein n=1 Tax=Alkalilimnicola ehrlichii TaxID=351052 RepID=UPI000E2F4E6B|nr:exopolysaccharide biosynthesis protein [Alkalilimnicola ehrlichii]RFA27767.1 exopolysaccharide biosynthesis protein [Alkalilimnicola ehrlichii]